MLREMPCVLLIVALTTQIYAFVKMNTTRHRINELYCMYHVSQGSLEVLTKPVGFGGLWGGGDGWMVVVVVKEGLWGQDGRSEVALLS